MRVVGLDIHRVFAEAVMLEDGAVRRLGRVDMTRDRLAAVARTLTHGDHVVVEATGNAIAVAEVIRPHVGRVVIASAAARTLSSGTTSSGTWTTAITGSTCARSTVQP